jgi:hypothetical protein
MATTPQNKEELFAQAISAGDLARVRELVEVHACAVHGPGPWNQLPLARAAENGHIHIIDYLASTRLGALPDESTLRAAIDGGKMDVLMHLLDEYELDWTEREYVRAFAAWHPAILKYAFELAVDDCWFEELLDAESRRKQVHIVQAARDAIARVDSSGVFDEIMEILRRGGRQGALFYVLDGQDDYGFLFDTIERRPRSFAAVWELAHECLFDGVRYGAMDNYVVKPLVDELFRKAITSHSHAVFYVLLQYGLPQFRQAIALAQESGNDEIAEYLTRCCA